MHNYLPLSISKGLAIEPYITVEELKDERGRILFRFIRFNLNRQSLKTILQARVRGQELRIDRHLLAQLRYCALSDGENRYKASRSQSGLTFCTYYRQRDSENIVMRSVISPDGDIIHQIRRDCFDYPKKCQAIATAHHWILEQLLNQLSLKTTMLVTWFSWLLSFPLVALAVIVFPKTFHPVNLLLILLLAILTWWLLQELFNYLLRVFLPAIKAWPFHQLLSGLLSPNSRDKKIAKVILSRFVP